MEEEVSILMTLCEGLAEEWEEVFSKDTHTGIIMGTTGTIGSEPMVASVVNSSSTHSVSEVGRESDSSSDATLLSFTTFLIKLVILNRPDRLKRVVRAHIPRFPTVFGSSEPLLKKVLAQRNVVDPIFKELGRVQVQSSLSRRFVCSSDFLLC